MTTKEDGRRTPHSEKIQSDKDGRGEADADHSYRYIYIYIYQRFSEGKI